MTRKKKNRQSPGKSEVVEFIRRPDLSILSGSIRSIPFALWKENMLFADAPDTELKQLTGSFPATFRQKHITHPVFVLVASQTGHFLCPCSTKGTPGQNRYIREGCRLINGRDHETDKRSYLVETCSFTLPLDKRFSRNLIYLGEVPASCIIDNRRKS
ncbi:MAG: hypothetical protein WBN83_03315 [Desulfoprunum sp.]|jgi:hypothetical protein|uniref:hypothetical protein n=1 Tax=Desulfoprunum sp. TaxID=2020866 RepID=UPI003C709116